LTIFGTLGYYKIMSKILEIYTDGGCIGNGKEGFEKFGGFGCVMVFEDKPLAQYSQSYVGTTNNRMELRAVIHALKTLVMNHEKLKIFDGVRILTDSQYCINGATTWRHNWKKNNWKVKNTPIKNPDLWIELSDLLDEVNQKYKLEFQWVKGHAGNKYNEMVDELTRVKSDTVIEDVF
jgi:ribonuclease HI